MHVLNLVTNRTARCYRLQVETLESMGVETTTLAVPGTSDWSEEGSRSRGVTDYLRFVPTVLRQSFDDYDLVHVNYGLTGPAAVLQPNLPVVLGLWGSDLFGRYAPISKLSARFSDEVVVMSGRMAEELDRDCHVIPHGVDLDQFAPEPQADARERLGWDHDADHVLFPYAPTREVKNFPRAERVVEAVQRRYDGRVELQTVTGVPHDRMPTYMNAADAMLLTSDHEGSPNATKEALACNLPVVATDVGDVTEQLDGVSLSRVGRTDDELIEGVLDALRADGRSNGRRRARDYSLGRMGEDLLGVYERAVQ